MSKQQKIISFIACALLILNSALLVCHIMWEFHMLNQELYGQNAVSVVEPWNYSL